MSAARLAAIAGVIAIGLVWRRGDLGLPFFWWKYGGSALWGAMVYLIVALAGLRGGVRGAVLVALAIAVVVEVSRLYHTPWLDDFRLTTAGALTLDRTFSVWNIVAYAVGIAGAALADLALTRPRRSGWPPAP